MSVFRRVSVFRGGVCGCVDMGVRLLVCLRDGPGCVCTLAVTSFPLCMGEVSAFLWGLSAPAPIFQMATEPQRLELPEAT